MQLREEPPLVFLRLLHPDIQLDPPKVFLQFTILHPGSEWITVTFCVCKLCSGEFRTHSVSVFQYGLVKHELCGLLLTFSVYSKFYSSDT